MSVLKWLVKAIIPNKYHTQLRAIYWYIRSFPYIGHGFECPCCRGHFRKFLPFGVKPRLNAQCPRCGSLERHRALHLYVKNRTNLFTNTLRVLHIAPEPALRNIFISAPNLDYISVNLSSPFAMIKMDITNIAFEDNCFDVILCSHVLEHITDDLKAMKELFRVLRPGGWAILQVPILREKTFEDPIIKTPEEREKAFGQHDHVRICGLDYKERLRSAGFNAKIDSYVKELGKHVIEWYGLMKNENIYFCTKPR